MPWEAITEVTGTWLFGRFCGVWIAFDIMCSTASILHLCIISVDRYWAIASPFKYERKMTQRVAFVMIGVAWSLSILISFIPVQLNWHQVEEEVMAEVVEMMAAADAAAGANSGGRNFTNSSNANAKSCVANLNKTYAISSSLISFYIPVVIMIATYTRIFRIAQTQIRRITSLERAAEQAQNHGHGANRNRQQQQWQQHHRPNDEASLKSSFKKETKVLKTLSIIMGVFVFCWLPFFVLNCTVPFCDPPCVSDATFTVFVWFGWANSSLNPVIYAFNADFRRAFATILGCNQMCSNNAVEAVNFSDELVSYHHDTTLHKEALVPAATQQLPCNIIVGANHLEDMSAQFDEESMISNGSPSCNRLLLLPATVQLEDDHEISLETITPFTSAVAGAAGMESNALIPGQVHQDG
ncbi:D(5)-like dopamine receptor [Etheostoma cragini]|uniref:D(5)-like dopamine receptor n=1 Tax=Etheostoma cragini TaxID=417921 RepID=UPI00155E564B|nr:D(5)-like dopamine receptor [Etheostoma cragini]